MCLPLKNATDRKNGITSSPASVADVPVSTPNSTPPHCSRPLSAEPVNIEANTPCVTSTELPLAGMETPSDEVLPLQKQDEEPLSNADLPIADACLAPSSEATTRLTSPSEALSEECEKKLLGLDSISHNDLHSMSPSLNKDFEVTLPLQSVTMDTQSAEETPSGTDQVDSKIVNDVHESDILASSNSGTGDTTSNLLVDTSVDCDSAAASTEERNEVSLAESFSNGISAVEGDSDCKSSHVAVATSEVPEIPEFPSCELPDHNIQPTNSDSTPVANEAETEHTSVDTSVGLPSMSASPLLACVTESAVVASCSPPLPTTTAAVSSQCSSRSSTPVARSSSPSVQPGLTRSRSATPTSRAATPTIRTVTGPATPLARCGTPSGQITPLSDPLSGETCTNVCSNELDVTEQTDVASTSLVDGCEAENVSVAPASTEGNVSMSDTAVVWPEPVVVESAVKTADAALSEHIDQISDDVEQAVTADEQSVKPDVDQSLLNVADSTVTVGCKEQVLSESGNPLPESTESRTVDVENVAIDNAVVNETVADTVSNDSAFGDAIELAVASNQQQSVEDGLSSNCVSEGSPSVSSAISAVTTAGSESVVTAACSPSDHSTKMTAKDWRQTVTQDLRNHLVNKL